MIERTLFKNQIRKIISDFMNDMNMTKMKEDWQIEKFTKLRNIQASAVVDAMMMTIHRENTFKSKGRISKFTRSTRVTDHIAHNYMVEQIIEHSLNKGR